MTVEKLQLTLQATGLKNVAGLGKGTSDPFAIVTLLATGPGEKPRVLGKTEVIKNSLSPKWTTSFLFDYSFGKETHINVSVVDEVRKQSDKPMGCECFRACLQCVDEFIYLMIFALTHFLYYFSHSFHYLHSRCIRNWRYPRQSRKYQSQKTKKGRHTLRSYIQSSTPISRKASPSFAGNQTQKCRWIV